jgi:hypothetical protein
LRIFFHHSMKNHFENRQKKKLKRELKNISFYKIMLKINGIKLVQYLR